MEDPIPPKLRTKKSAKKSSAISDSDDSGEIDTIA